MQRPDSVVLIGYGGMSVEYETRVYNYRGFEFRVPRCPVRFPPDKVAETYECFSAYTWQGSVEAIDDLLAPTSALM